MSALSFKRVVLTLSLLFVLLGIAFAVSLLFGTVRINGGEEGAFVLLQIRLPRTILAFLVGMALALAGAVFSVFTE